MATTLCIFGGIKLVNIDVNCVNEYLKGYLPKFDRIIFGGNTGLLAICFDLSQQLHIKHEVFFTKQIFQRLFTFNSSEKLPLYSYKVTEDYLTRKKLMLAESDHILILPGGIGTLDEFFHVIASNDAKEPYIKCDILNVGGYFDDILSATDNILKVYKPNVSLSDLINVIRI